MQRTTLLFLSLIFLWSSCRPASHSDKSFDQICDLVTGKTAAEVEELLGPPDARQRILLVDERWIWWNYTFLDGETYPPEFRGLVVHLEITFHDSLLSRASHPAPSSSSQWRVSSPLAVSYSIPGSRSAPADL